MSTPVLTQMALWKHTSRWGDEGREVGTGRTLGEGLEYSQRELQILEGCSVSDSYRGTLWEELNSSSSR